MAIPWSKFNRFSREWPNFDQCLTVPAWMSCKKIALSSCWSVISDSSRSPCPNRGYSSIHTSEPVYVFFYLFSGVLWPADTIRFGSVTELIAVHPCNVRIMQSCPNNICILQTMVWPWSPIHCIIPWAHHPHGWKFSFRIDFFTQFSQLLTMDC